MLLSLCICLFLSLQVFAAPSAQIIGGEEVRPPGKYGWQGYLERGAVNPSFACGCILIGARHVLTASHCADAFTPEDYFVTFGAHDRETEIDGQPETYNVVNITVHPDWVNNGNLGFPNDIAVLELATDANIDNNVYITAIDLPEAGRTPDDWVDMSCVISGWGRVDGGVGGELPNILQEVEIPVITEQLCDERWQELDYDVISDIHVCVWDEVNQDKGSCNGDSGGPLVCQAVSDGDGPYELVGITSWGLSGCGTDYPSVYVRVSTFRDWIDSVMPQ